jgi:hypothetical protein
MRTRHAWRGKSIWSHVGRSQHRVNFTFQKPPSENIDTATTIMADNAEGPSKSALKKAEKQAQMAAQKAAKAAKQATVAVVGGKKTDDIIGITVSKS